MKLKERARDNLTIRLALVNVETLRAYQTDTNGLQEGQISTCFQGVPPAEDTKLCSTVVSTNAISYNRSGPLNLMGWGELAPLWCGHNSLVASAGGG